VKVKLEKPVTAQCGAMWAYVPGALYVAWRGYAFWLVARAV